MHSSVISLCIYSIDEMVCFHYFSTIYNNLNYIRLQKIFVQPSTGTANTNSTTKSIELRKEQPVPSVMTAILDETTHPSSADDDLLMESLR